MRADKHQSFLQVDFNTLGIKFSYKVILPLLMGMVKHSQSTQSNKSFIMSQLLLYLVIPSVLMYSCDHIICPGLSVLFLYAPAHKAWIFEKFVFELEAFLCDFKIDCILVCQLIISLNKKMVVSSGKFNIFISWFHICTSLILVSASMKIVSTL